MDTDKLIQWIGDVVLELVHEFKPGYWLSMYEHNWEPGDAVADVIDGYDRYMEAKDTEANP